MTRHIALVLALTLLTGGTHSAKGMPTEDQRLSELQQEVEVLLEEIDDIIGPENKGLAEEREREAFMDDLSEKRLEEVRRPPGPPLCTFPFTYLGKTYHTCTNIYHNQPWCSPNAEYNGKWNNCYQNCQFPFTYRGKTYSTCTTVNHNRPWCSKDAVYNGRWEVCHMSCAFPFRYDGKSYNGCTSTGHGEPWCSKTVAYEYKWTNCGTGGTCYFPFEYQGKIYDRCTKIGHDRLWCSTTAAYEGKWINC